jgi:hypothetical protein
MKKRQTFDIKHKEKQQLKTPFLFLMPGSFQLLLTARGS